ncbi:sigma factor-like helix-turn-helix DNA-binding protein [Clostridium sp. AWRP]|uniref:sigma factor-like helix-turn-helix DNA-binding protein n=1 Tax=Clostridium sp. AWRP TaxID=2212991 RepID=UPI000FD7549C|nr:sigma factor-like helix-turn-helix DNA-binding protein [Clostridium sp. AWRP]AZV56785.1 hypothetical protein DMR38_09325 [Clostridium sp. AWRP]
MNKKEFDKINEVESFLYNYKSIKLAIENLKMELATMDEPSISAIQYKECTGKTNKFNSDVENKILQKELLESRIKHMETKIKQIDKALSILPDIEREIIQYRYIEGKNYYEFTYKIYKSERQARRLKNKALQKIVIVFFGIE